MSDVVLAGGGPAGLCAAIAAACAGMSVAVLERDGAFGIPTRTSGGTFLADMRELGVPDHLLNPVRRTRFVGPSTTSEVLLDPPVVGVLDVRGLYQWLAQPAAAGGAALHLPSPGPGLEPPADAVGVSV